MCFWVQGKLLIIIYKTLYGLCSPRWPELGRSVHPISAGPKGRLRIHLPQKSRGKGAAPGLSDSILSPWNDLPPEEKLPHFYWLSERHSKLCYTTAFWEELQGF